MRPFGPRGQSNAGGWSATSARNGFAGQQSWEGSNSWDNSQSRNGLFQPSGLLGTAPSFGSFQQSTNAMPSFGSFQQSARPTAPFGGRGGAQVRANQPRGGGQPRGAGQTRGRGAMIKPGAAAAIRKAQKEAAPKAPAPTAKVQQGPPAKLEDMLTKLKSYESSFEVLRGMHGQIFKMQSDVAKIKQELDRRGSGDAPAAAESKPAAPATNATGQQAKKRPAADAPESTPKVLKLDRPFRTCVHQYGINEALLAPTSPTSGQLVIAGQPSLPVTPDDYYVYTRGIHSFSKLMAAQKVQCEVAHIAFEDGTTESVVLRIHPLRPTTKEYFARTMKKIGIEGRIVIKSPDFAQVKCFRKKDTDWFDVTPDKFYMNKKPLTTFEGLDAKIHLRFFPDLELLEKEGKFVCTSAWEKANFPFERPIDKGCLIELFRIQTTGVTNCQVLTGEYRGCLARLEPDIASNFTPYDILKCDVQVGEDSNLHALNPVLVPTKKVVTDPNKVHVSPLESETIFESAVNKMPTVASNV